VEKLADIRRITSLSKSKVRGRQKDVCDPPDGIDEVG
jgi:hypothetical protein